MSISKKKKRIYIYVIIIGDIFFYDYYNYTDSNINEIMFSI